MHTYMHACMHAYIHTYIDTHIHTYIHTYTHTIFPWLFWECNVAPGTWSTSVTSRYGARGGARQEGLE